MIVGGPANATRSSDLTVFSRNNAIERFENTIGDPKRTFPATPASFVIPIFHQKIAMPDNCP
jgi:hypothetical protein